MNALVTLNCPLCDKPYQFDPDGISQCESCGHEIQKADRKEETPRITPAKWLSLAWAGLLFGGIVCLFFYPVGLMIGLALIFTAVVLANHFLDHRRGNCGARLAHRHSYRCITCGASLVFKVR